MTSDMESSCFFSAHEQSCEIDAISPVKPSIEKCLLSPIRKVMGESKPSKNFIENPEEDNFF